MYVFILDRERYKADDKLKFSEILTNKLINDLYACVMQRYETNLRNLLLTRINQSLTFI